MQETPKTKSFLTDKQYRLAKALTVTFLPAIGTLYFALSVIWGLPAGQAVLGTMMAIQAFLGVILGISSNQYENSGQKYSGEINITEKDGEKKASVAFNEHPTELDGKDEAIFKVNAPK